MSEAIIQFPSPMPGSFATAEDARAFLLAGRAAFIIESQSTGRSFAYRVEASPDLRCHFVKLLTGGGMEYLGVLCDSGIRITSASDARSDDMAVMALGYVWRHLIAGRMPPSVTLTHEGRCGVCHRALRDVTSVRTGIGPECRKRALVCTGDAS